MKRSKSAASLVPLGLVAGAAAAGCGGSGPQQVTATELVQKADAICSGEREKFSKIQAAPPPNATAAHDQTEQLIDAAKSSLSDLNDLEPPPSVRTAYDRYLSAVGRAIDQMQEGADAADAQDSRAYAAAQSAVTKTEAKRDQLARSLGLKVCSKPTS